MIAAAFGFQGQKCSACSRVIVDAKIYDEFVSKLKPLAEALTQGSPEDPAKYMGTVIGATAEKSHRTSLDIVKSEEHLTTAGAKTPGPEH